MGSERWCFGLVLPWSDWDSGGWRNRPFCFVARCPSHALLTATWAGCERRYYCCVSDWWLRPGLNDKHTYWAILQVPQIPGCASLSVVIDCGRGCSSLPQSCPWLYTHLHYPIRTGLELPMIARTLACQRPCWLWERRRSPEASPLRPGSLGWTSSKTDSISSIL